MPLLSMHCMLRLSQHDHFKHQPVQSNGSPGPVAPLRVAWLYRARNCNCNRQHRLHSPPTPINPTKHILNSPTPHAETELLLQPTCHDIKVSSQAVVATAVWLLVADYLACNVSPCKVGDPNGRVTCREKSPTPQGPDGRRCECALGYEYSEAKGCTSEQALCCVCTEPAKPSPHWLCLEKLCPLHVNG